MNKEELIKIFVSSDENCKTIFGRSSFKALTDEEFAIITTLGANEGHIHVTASAAVYIEQRKSGILPVPLDDGNQPDKNESKRILVID